MRSVQRRALPFPDKGLHHRDPLIELRVAAPALHIAFRYVFSVSESKV